MEEKKILITRPFPDIGIDLLKKQGFILNFWTQDRPMTPEELAEQAKECNAILCTLTEKIDQTFLDRCSHLDLVSQFAVGYDNIDVTHATGLGIPVGFTPDVMTEATADIAFGLMIATARKMVFNHKLILKGEWDYFRPKEHLGMELMGKTLGIFGMGRIGMKMAQRCQGAYDMKILYCSRNPYPEAEEKLNAVHVTFEELLEQSDIVSAHCPLTPETRGIFNGKAFGLMKPSAIFINTARGPVHNEEDLIQALESGEIWGAGLDVTNPEPMVPDNPLLSMENVCILPHIGSATREARDGMSRLAAENIIEFYRTGTMPHMVNPEVLKR